MHTITNTPVWQIGVAMACNNRIDSNFMIIHLPEEQQQDNQAKLADLRRVIAIGIEQADRGELAPFNPHATLERIRSRHIAVTRSS